MKAIDDLVYTLEVVYDAVLARNKDKGFEAVTIFLLQFFDTFGHAPTLFSKTFAVLEKLKDRIQAGDFEEAIPIVLALLAKMREVKDAMKSSTSG